MLTVDVDLSRQVKARTLIPAEVPTSLKLLKQGDCYQQWGIKYPQRSTFHSYAELLHFALCEGDPGVTAFIPQPYRLRVNGRPYVPDAYLVRSGERIVYEIKPRGEFEDALRLPLTAFFRFKGMRFHVVSNESILEREIEALNWLHVVRTLATATEIQTDTEERELWGYFLTRESAALGDVLDPGDRLLGYGREIALYRLLHRGQLRAHWTDTRVGPDTVIERCV